MSQPEGERLQKVLGRAGVASRRAAEDLIRAGRVRVNGRPAQLGQRVDPDKDQVEVDGSTVPLREGLVHLLLNKPSGYVSTTSDPEGRPTVVELVDAEQRVWPVGRLDIDTEGALLITNDGELTARLTHPRYSVPKTYVAEVHGRLEPRVARRLAAGVELSDGRTAPARVNVLERASRGTVVELTISEGRNRQVRRMFDAVEHPVRRLVRTEIGPLKLGRLKPGTFRRLGPREVHELYRATETK